MDQANKKAKKLGKELWIFFDEINTCLSLSLLTEIFINRTYNEKKLEDIIRLIVAYNSYRKLKKDKEKCGLSRPLEKDKEKGELNRLDDIGNKLVYLVQPFPQSLLYYVFILGAIDKIDEKKYIRSIIEELFTSNEKSLHEMTKEAISPYHIYLRKEFDASVVSLREIQDLKNVLNFSRIILLLKIIILGKKMIKKIIN